MKLVVLPLFILILAFAPKPIACADPAKTVGVTVDVPMQEQRNLIEGAEKGGSEVSAEEIGRHVKACLATRNPTVVLSAISRATSWATYGPGGADKRNERIAVVRPFIDECLSSKEPFSRLAGVAALAGLQDEDRLRRELERDSSFLLARPENKDCVLQPPAPNESPEVGQKRIAAIMVVADLARTREGMISMCGELRIQPAKESLRAIAADSSSELVRNTAKVATSALAAIEGAEPTEVMSGGGRIMFGERLDGPDIEFKGTQAKTIAIVVKPLTMSQRKLERDLGDASDKGDFEKVVSLCEKSFKSNHPYLKICALEEAARCAHWNRTDTEKRNEKRAAIDPLIERCLRSPDPIERMAGVNALHIHDGARFKIELEKDSSFLLIRPDPPRTKREKTLTDRRSLDISLSPLAKIADCRTFLIGMAGKLKIESARGNLEAIVLDSHSDDYSHAAYEARRAINRIDEKKPKKVSVGKKELQEIPASQP